MAFKDVAGGASLASIGVADVIGTGAAAVDKVIAITKEVISWF